MPKLSVNAVGDEFQMLDDQRHWAAEMAGEMKTVLIRNADHLLVTNFALVLQSVTAFYQSVVFEAPRPSYSWSIDATTGQIFVNTSVPPKSVELIYTGIPAGRRDFRDIVKTAVPCVIHPMGGCLRFLWWFTTSAVMLSHTSFSTNVTAPTSGYVGFYLQLTFASGRPDVEDYVFASPASVLPLGFPFPDCHGSACNGTLC